MDIKFPIEDPTQRGALYGTADRNLKLIRAAFDVRISARNSTVHITGSEESVEQAADALKNLRHLLESQGSISDEDVDASIRLAAAQKGPSADPRLDVFLSGANIVPKGDGQREYVNAMLHSDLTLCLGPAGTGKTYLAAAVATYLLKHNKIKRIVLVRPAVEAGEKLGYLPGDLQAKVNPYLRPLFDAMHDMMSFDQLHRFMQNDVIEVVPLAFMRGRTLNNAAIILDEAQNATTRQMLMFLTRLGHHSRMIVTGDDSQSDLAKEEASGFIDAVRRLEPIPGVAVVRLTDVDIVRHPLVQQVVAVYARGRSNVP